MRRCDVTPEQMLKGGQVICGRNATRRGLNNAMKRAAGFAGSISRPGRGEKIICLKNRHDLGLDQRHVPHPERCPSRGRNELSFSATVQHRGRHSRSPAGQHF